jgi:hypothetical protein
MDQATFQKIVDDAMASLSPSAKFGYGEAFDFFSNLRAQLVTAGATDVNIVPWLHDCLSPSLIEASGHAQIADAMRALCDAFGYVMTVDAAHKVTLRAAQGELMKPRRSCDLTGDISRQLVRSTSARPRPNGSPPPVVS